MPAIAERLGCRRAVRVRRTSDVATPCLAGLWRPVLLLPERECEAVRTGRPAGDPRPRADARAESRPRLEPRGSRRFDPALVPPAGLANPRGACGGVRRRLRCRGRRPARRRGLVQSDARSAGRAGGLAVAGPRAGHGPHVGRPPTPRCLEPEGVPNPALVEACHACALRGKRAPGAHRRLRLHACRAGRPRSARRAGEGRLDAQGQLRQPEDRTMAGKLTLRAVAAETNEPIEGVSIAYRGAAPTGRTRDGHRHDRQGRDGDDRISTEPQDRISSRSPPASRNSCRSISSGTTSGTRWNCRPRRSCASSPARRSAGSSGTRPAIRSKGPRSTSTAPPTEYEGTHHVFSLGELKTDAQGRWRLDVAPRNLAKSG